MVGSVDEDGSVGGWPSRTTYLSELLAPVERLADVPAPAEPETGLTALSWAFVLVAVAALVVGGLIVFDVARPGPPSTVSQGPVRTAETPATGR